MALEGFHNSKDKTEEVKNWASGTWVSIKQGLLYATVKVSAYGMTKCMKDIGIMIIVMGMVDS